MNDATRLANNLAAVPSHVAMGKPSVVNPSASSKRPRPYVKECEPEELAWDPIAVPQYLPLEDEAVLEEGEDGQPKEMTSCTADVVRSGDSYAVCRPGHRRWPLGHVSDVYKISAHRVTDGLIKEFCAHAVAPFGKPLMSGIGYRVVHQYAITHLDELMAEAGKDITRNVHGLDVTSRLTVVHDHTGLHALKARMVVYVGDDPIGSYVGARAIHVSENGQRWRSEVQAMVEKSILAQDVIINLLQAADKHLLTEGDKALLDALKVPVAPGWSGTLLDSVIQYFRGKNSEITWGVWERRLSDSSVVAMCRVMADHPHGWRFGFDLDDVLGGKRFSGKTAGERDAFRRRMAEKKAG